MSKNHDAIAWAAISKRERARIKRERVVYCIHCGGPIDTLVDAFDVSHVVDLHAGGSDAGTGPGHVRCNRSAGGVIGAQITNGTRHRRTDARMRTW